MEEETRALLSGDSNSTALSSDGSHLALLSNRLHTPACANSYLTNGGGGQGEGHQQSRGREIPLTCPPHAEEAVDQCLQSYHAQLSLHDTYTNFYSGLDVESLRLLCQ